MNPDDLMVVVNGVRYRIEDAEVLGLVPAPPAAEKTKTPVNKSRTPANKRRAARSKGAPDAAAVPVAGDS